MKRLKCIICGNDIEDHGRRYCKACRGEAYRAASRRWKERQYQIKPKAGYKSLALAIAQQACRDYYDAKYHEDVVSFFKSYRCYEMTGVAGEDYISALEKRNARKIKRIGFPEETAPEIREEVIKSK